MAGDTGRCAVAAHRWVYAFGHQTGLPFWLRLVVMPAAAF